jgi:hypothetical protein
VPGGPTLVSPTSSARSISYLVADLRSFDDENFQLERRIRELSAEDPYTQTQYDEDLEAQPGPNNRVYCICIYDFFTDHNNLVYYINGTQNVKMFSLGMTGMEAFDGAVLFIIGPYSLSHVLKPVNIKDSKVEWVGKSNMPLEHVKWRYIFETGRLVWNKSDVDLGKLEEIMATRSAQSSSRPGPLGKGIGTTSQSPGTGDKRPDDSCVPGDKSKENETGDLPRSDGAIGGPDDPLIDGQTEQDRRYLAIYTKMLSGNLDRLWTVLKEKVSKDPEDHELKYKILPIVRLEEELAICRAEASDTKEDADKLSQIETSIKVCQTRLFQIFANTWAEKWQRNCAKMLGSKLRDSMGKNDSRSDVKNRLMVALMVWDDDTPQISDIGVQEADIKAVMNIAENYELRKDCLGQIEAAVPRSRRLSELYALHLSLEDEAASHICELVPTLFNRFGHTALEDLNFLSTEEPREQGLTVGQEEILANVMEAMNTFDRELAIRLLKKSHWVADVALAMWWDRDIPIDPPVNEDQANWSDKKLGKRPVRVVVQEKGESSKANERDESREETLEEAQARLEKIIAATRKGG